jgi:hypothetical protein
MKPTLNFIFVVSIIVFTSINCSDNTVEPELLNSGLVGKWNENFKWIHTQCVEFESESSFCEIERTCRITFFKDSFEVKIIPYTRIYYSDTLYSGKYTIRGDTIIFNPKNLSSRQKYLYKFYSDSLELYAAPEANSDSIYIFAFSSFIWDFGLLKNGGILNRIE